MTRCPLIVSTHDDRRNFSEPNPVWGNPEEDTDVVPGQLCDQSRRLGSPAAGIKRGILTRKRVGLRCSNVLKYFAILFCFVPMLLHSGQIEDTGNSTSRSRVEEVPTNLLLPGSGSITSPLPAEQTPDYRKIIGQSFRFLLVENAFRYATEDGARHAHASFLGGYTSSVTNLHGWADGDPFIVNYVGHPMQGAVAGRI